MKALPEISISMWTTSSTQRPKSYSAGPLCKTTSKTGTQPDPLAERLPKIIIRSQTHQNTPLDAVLPTRKPRSSIIHQNTGTSPSNRKPTQSTEPTLPSRGRHQKQHKQQTCSLWKGDPKHSKLSKMRRQRNAQQMKEQGKNPPDLTNEEDIGSTWKIILTNDSKDDPKSWI